MRVLKLCINIELIWCAIIDVYNAYIDYFTMPLNVGHQSYFRVITHFTFLFYFLYILLTFLFLLWSLHKWKHILRTKDKHTVNMCCKCVFLFRCTLTNRMLWAGRGFTQCTAAVSMGSKTWQPYWTSTTGPFYTTCSSATHRRAYMWANTQQNHPHTLNIALFVIH